jgi:hypothetical protein
MQLVEENSASRRITFSQVEFPNVPANSGNTETILYEMRINKLREAIRKNQVSFPSQVPTFPKHDRPDLQRKLVQLYFVLGWSASKIGVRCALKRTRVQQILNTWKRRAVEMGYVQTVPPAETYMLSSEHLPIQVVLSPVLDSSIYQVPQLKPLPIDAHQLTADRLTNGEQASFRTDSEPDHRGREKLNVVQVATLLKQLPAGRTVAETADETGISESAVRTSKEQYELRLLRRENIQLKQRLANLDADRKTLIDLITRSDDSGQFPFMPFSRVSPHT